MSLVIEQTRDIAACRALRRVVFIEEQNVSETDEIDGLDGGALHIIARDGDVAIGSARMIISGHTAKIGRVCVLRGQRGRGIGAQIVQAALEVAAGQPGVTRAKLGAQLHALTFYQKLGFSAFGPVYDDAGIDHRDMERAV